MVDSTLNAGDTPCIENEGKEYINLQRSCVRRVVEKSTSQWHCKGE